MRATLFMRIILFTCTLMLSFESMSQSSKVQGIRAYNIDYNGDPNGGYINAFAKPGLWADADPEELMEWYEDLGCNAVHSFAFRVMVTPGIKMERYPNSRG